MRVALATALSVAAAVAAAGVVWAWWRSPIPTFLLFTPVLQGMLLGAGLHYVGAALRVNRSRGWIFIAALAGCLSFVAVTLGQYWSDAYAYRDATRRATALLPRVPGALGPHAAPLGVLEGYDRNVLLPRTGRTGIRGYTRLRYGRPAWRGWLRLAEGLTVIVLAAALSAPQRQDRPRGGAPAVPAVPPVPAVPAVPAVDDPAPL